MIRGVNFLEYPMLVQKLRLQRGWSQQQLADLSGLSIRTIQRIENGQSASIETMKSLASVFEIDFTQLQPEPEPEMNSSSNNAASEQHVNPSSMAQSNASTEEILAMRHVAKLKAFYLKVISYVLIVGCLTVLNWLTSPHYWWVHWVAIGWGLALAIKAVKVFELVPFFGADWEKKEIEKRLGRPLK